MRIGPSLEALYADLVRHGLPAGYARRNVEELADHHRDLVNNLLSEGFSADQASAEAWERLGERKQLRKRIVREFRGRSFAGRFPLCTFLLGPPAMLALAWAATFLIATPIVMLLEKCFGIVGGVPDGHFSLADRICFNAFWFTFMLLVPGVLAAGYAWLASKTAMNSLWALLACVLIAMPVSLPAFSVDVESARGLMTIPFPFVGGPELQSFFGFISEWFLNHPTTVLQLLLPLAAGGTVIVHSARHRRKLSTLAWSPLGGAEDATPAAA